MITDLPSYDSKGNRIKLMGAKFVYKLKTGDDGAITRWHIEKGMEIKT